MRIPYMKACPECAKESPAGNDVPVIQLDTGTGKYTCVNNHDLPNTVLDNGGKDPDSPIIGQPTAEDLDSYVAIQEAEQQAASETAEQFVSDPVTIQPDEVAQPFDYTGPGTTTVLEPTDFFSQPMQQIVVPPSLEKILTDVNYELPLAGGDVVIGVRIPEAYVGAIREYAQSQGKTFSEYINERVAFGMENQWFL